MNTKRDQSIQEIMTSFEKMSDLVLAQLSCLEKLMADPLNNDIEKIKIDIRRNEEEIDMFEVLVSDQIINSIVLYQPVASDIRRIIAVYRMTINLERIG